MARPQPGLSRRALLAAAAGLAAAGGRAFAAEAAFPISGRLSQGGFLIGRADPRAALVLDGEAVGQASASGLFIVGFDRDAKASAEVDAGAAQRIVSIAPVDYDIQRIDGLPQNQVTPTAPALLERIAREAAMKREAFASVIDTEDFRDGFAWPVQATRISARFGGQRVLNGEPERPHYGIDLAAPEGSEIRAPAPGLVTLAEPDMHYEGGLTFIDHGQGMVCAYLHQSRLFVRTGERVEAGQPIGLVGQTGRATGPHLCWRLKWRGRNLDPSLLVGARAPQV